MATPYEIVNSVVAASAAGGSITTPNVNMSGADFIVAGISFASTWAGGGAAATMADSQSNSYTGLTTYDSTTQGRVRLFYVLNPTVTTSMTFTAGNSGSSNYPSLFVVGFKGVTAYDKETGGGATSGTSISLGAVTPAQNNSLIVTAGSTSGFSAHESHYVPGTLAGLTLSMPSLSAAHYGGWLSFQFQRSATSTILVPQWLGSCANAGALAVFATNGIASGGRVIGGGV